jgi:hypothetical protein
MNPAITLLAMAFRFIITLLRMLSGNFLGK